MKILGASAPSSVLNIEDVFSTYVYTGTGAALDIVNGINLAGKGGMVWIKNRDAADSHVITDTERGVGEILSSDATTAETTDADTITAFSSTGFSLGADVKVNTNTEGYVSWTFRKAPRFFDIVTYTGNSVAGREISHDLGVAPGMIIVKLSVGTTQHWFVYHRSVGATKYLSLNNTWAEAVDSTVWNDTEPTSTDFSVGGIAATNGSGYDYVAYLFAHDPLGPSGDGSDGLIACGIYSGSGGTGVDIDLGWEPQYVLIKDKDSTHSWMIYDVIRGIVTNGDDVNLRANVSDAEYTFEDISVNPNGFTVKSASASVDHAAYDYIYMAIRRPMKTPESADEVFAIDNGNASVPGFTSGFQVDGAMYRNDSATISNTRFVARLTGATQLYTNLTQAEDSATSVTFDYMEGYTDFTSLGTAAYSWMLKRATGFFDVVCYTGTGVAELIVNHNLMVPPELVIIKRRSDTMSWAVYVNDIEKYSFLDTNQAFTDSVIQDLFGDDINFIPPDATKLTLGTWVGVNSVNTYIAYLFATLEGISKVGSYTGDGTTGQTIDCGFSAGASFIMIKRTDADGEWFFWDSVRGIIAGNDPHLSLNTTAAEVTTDDSIDPDNSGFIVNQVAATNVNVNTAEYIFYAIAAI